MIDELVKSLKMLFSVIPAGLKRASKVFLDSPVRTGNDGI
jgi:hypothetical protein